MRFRDLLLAIALLGLGTVSLGCTDSSRIDREPCPEDQQCVEELCRELVRCRIFHQTNQAYCEFTTSSCVEDLTENERSNWYLEVRECLRLSDCLDIEGCYFRMSSC